MADSRRETMVASYEPKSALAGDREIISTRLFDAPRELVFKVWTDPDHVAKWWGPDGFTTSTHKIDVRPGGEWLFTMHGPDGVDYENRVRYEEIVPPERLVVMHDDGGGGGAFRNVVTFEDQDGKTLLTMHATFERAADRTEAIEQGNAVEGGKQHLQRLAEYLEKQIREAR